MESTDKEVEVKKNIINKIKVSKEQREKIYVKIDKNVRNLIVLIRKNAMKKKFVTN